MIARSHQRKKVLREDHVGAPCLDLRAGGLLDDFSRFYSDWFLNDFSPQEFCVFVKQ